MFGLGGMTDQGGGGLGDRFRNRIESWRAHPFQNFASTLAGGLAGPAGGELAQDAFGRYNDSQFSRAFDTLGNRSLQQTTMDTNDAMNKPLSGSLGDYDRLHPFGEQGPQSMAGQGMGGGFGGPMGGGGYSYGNFAGQLRGEAPPQQSSFVNDILNSISTGPGLPGTQQGGLFGSPNGPMSGFNPNGPLSQFSPQGPLGQFMNHADRVDYRDNLGNNGAGMSANYGISPMMANGQQMITGFTGNDMNQLRVRGRSPAGY